MTRNNKRKFTVKLVESGDVLNTRVIAEIVAKQLRKGDMV